jgi:hypothetical protein
MGMLKTFKIKAKKGSDLGGLPNGSASSFVLVRTKNDMLVVQLN